jgi:hypothetical protein
MREAVVERLDDADQHATDHRAHQVADAAEHRPDERDQSELDALAVPGRTECLYREHGGGARRPSNTASEACQDVIAPMVQFAIHQVQQRNQHGNVK